jgi:biotin synthase
MRQNTCDIFQLEFKELFKLFAHATELRERRSGKEVSLCFILNAKAGNCPQNCGFCSQSAVSRADIPRYPLMSVQEITAAAEAAYQNGAYHFCIVTSGRGVRSKPEQKTILAAIEAIRSSVPVKVCASLGIVNGSFLKKLREVGLHHFHHNLETSPAFFPEVCTSHTFQQRVRTIEAAKTAGLKVCSGGIFGIGESVQDRLDLASWLQRLEVDSIPLNFLHPVEGTPMESRTTMKPIECLQVITAFRLLFQDKPLVICGGRGMSLRSLGPLMFAAGADGLLTGDYLTTKGKAPRQDAEMLADMDLSPKRPRS